MVIPIKIGGSKGDIVIAHPFHAADKFTLIKNGENEIIEIPVRGKGFVYEIEECQSCIALGKTQSEPWSNRNNIDLIKILDATRKEVGLEYPREQKVINKALKYSN